MRSNGVMGDRKREGRRGGREGEGWSGVGADRMENGGEKEEKEGEGSADPQLHPLMLHVSVSRSAGPALHGDKERISTKISVFTHGGPAGGNRIQMQLVAISDDV